MAATVVTLSGAFQAMQEASECADRLWARGCWATRAPAGCRFGAHAAGL